MTTGIGGGPSVGPTDEQIIGAVGNSLFDMALGDIHRGLGCAFPHQRITYQSELNDGQCLVGSVSQACVLIEAAGHHVLGGLPHGSRAAFQRFVQDFMPTYNAVDLYEVLRCGLLHEYGPQHHPNPGQPVNPVRFVLVKNAHSLHLTPVDGHPTHFYLNIQTFIEDVDDAICEFLKRADQPASAERASAVGWANQRGVMAISPFVLPNVEGGAAVLFCELSSSIQPTAALSTTLTASYTPTRRPHIDAGRPSFEYRSKTHTRSGRTIV